MKLLQQKAKEFVECRNGIRVRKQDGKPGPSSMSRNTAYCLPKRWGGRDCLIPVDVEKVREMKEKIGGASLLEFNTQEFSDQAQAVYDTLSIKELGYSNVWDVYQEMLEILYQ